MTHKGTHNSVDYLLKTMQELRAPDGCPWDAVQTAESLSPYILEEACELIDAIESGDPKLIMDELGDLLLQVVFQAQIFNEQEQFSFHDVAQGIAEKLVRRHPHVFAQNSAEAKGKDLDKQWEEIKRSEATHNKTCLADHVPKHLPALQKAQKLITRAHKANRQDELFTAGHKSTRPLLDTAQRIEAGQIDEDSLGEALFQLANLAHEAGIDAETSLRKKTRHTLERLDSK